MRSKPIYKSYIVQPFLRLLRLRLLADPTNDRLPTVSSQAPFTNYVVIPTEVEEPRRAHRR
ncbi:hypothetical protein [Sphingobacterium nematocida]|uniref:hypothetical protein n=1 Tax=Sphingobacterium nematocida TaxID=1513896 RepID=UPI0011171B54|nr:hypothetical protein [Sphingobacterium nematocida]